MGEAVRYPSIDSEKCVGCMLCARACAHGVLSAGEGGVQINRRSRCFLCMHCTAVCPTGAVSFDYEALNISAAPAAENPAEKLILERRSVRHYKAEAPDRKIIERAISLSQWGPSARNEHKIKWIVISDKDLADTMADELVQMCAASNQHPNLVRHRRNGIHPANFAAPYIILATMPSDAYDPPVDCAIAVSLLEILLNEQGISTCWLGYFQRLLSAHPQYMEKIGIAENYGIYVAIAAGFADEPEYRIPPRPDADILWIDK